MSEDNGSPRVVDQRDASRFVLEQDGSEAELTYRLRDQELVLVHTGVPEALGGRGIGGTLVRAAVERAADEGLTIAPWCSYARKWLQDHEDEASRVTVNWAEPPHQ
jgi:predicted GNAT family acetyltransferase